MGKVIFTVQYEINSGKRTEFFEIINELKNLVKPEGLESYELYEVKGKKNHFQEVYTFSSEEAYDNFDDNQSERINILVGKLGELTVNNSTKYTTLCQVNSN